MNDDTGKYPSGYGYSWRGDWKQRLSHLLKLRGFIRLTDYARTDPLATLEQMTQALGEGDVAPIQLQWTLVEEAQQADELECCVRDLLVRHLREVPQGWPASRDWDAQEDVGLALNAWQVCLRDPRYNKIMEAIVTAMLNVDDIKPGWLPSGVDDAYIESLFKRYWRDGGAIDG
jgi:hypothetical protein